MRHSFKMMTLAAVVIGAPVWADTTAMPERQGPRPQTTEGVPHVQIGVDPVPALSETLLATVETFPGVNLGPTRVSLPGAVGFQLDRGLALAQPRAIVGGREFAHLHPDGSLHASLDLETGRAAIEAGWAIAHPWANERPGWEGFVMIYTPQNARELAVVIDLLRGSYTYITGLDAPE